MKRDSISGKGSQRRTAWRQVNASFAIEGLAPSAEELALQERLIRGEITIEREYRSLAPIPVIRIIHRGFSKNRRLLQQIIMHEL